MEASASAGCSAMCKMEPSRRKDSRQGTNALPERAAARSSSCLSVERSGTSLGSGTIRRKASWARVSLWASSRLLARTTVLVASGSHEAPPSSSSSSYPYPVPTFQPPDEVSVSVALVGLCFLGLSTEDTSTTGRTPAEAAIPGMMSCRSS